MAQLSSQFIKLSYKFATLHAFLSCGFFKGEAVSTRETINDLLLPVAGLSPDTRIDDVADSFLTDQYRHFLCLPVVDNDRVIGTISRYAIMRIFVQKFGREVFGSRLVTDFINHSPLLIEAEDDIETASRFIRERIQHPITEDFIITRRGTYAGVGIVLSLLELMENRASRRSVSLSAANRHLKASQARLVQSEKMASLGQMVAGLAHEMNTPLGYVSANLELIRDFSEQVARDTQPSPESESAAAINDISTLVADSLHGLQQMGALVTGLRSFSRLDHAQQERVCMNMCIDGALTIARHVVQPKAEVVRDFGENVWLWCVPSQINQVLLNLLTNAAQAIDQYGRITLRTRKLDEHIEISVRDSGRGIPVSLRRKIFDPFFTTKPIGEGTGLGLSISYQIIRQHGGTISLRSAEGKGTEFLLRLPREAALTRTTGNAA